MRYCLQQITIFGGVSRTVTFSKLRQAHMFEDGATGSIAYITNDIVLLPRLMGEVEKAWTAKPFMESLGHVLH